MSRFPYLPCTRLLTALLAVCVGACEGAEDDAVTDASSTGDTDGAGETGETGESDETAEVPTTGGESGDEPPPPGEPDRARACEPLSSEGGFELGPDGSWQTFIEAAEPGSTFLLADGTYVPAPGDLTIPEGVTVRSASGNRDAVIFELYGSGHVYIQGSDVVLADLTIRGGQYPLSIDADPFLDSASGVLIHNLHIIDASVTAIGVAGDDYNHSDAGEIRCTLLEAAAPDIDHVFGADVGIEIAGATGWKLRDNEIRGFHTGIGAWNDASGAVIERNLLAESAYGLRFGLASADLPGGCGGGLARNNLVLATNPAFTGSGHELASILVDGGCDLRIEHNTLVSLTPDGAAVELRTFSSSVTISNNLMSHDISDEEGLGFQGAGNLGAATDSVVDAASGRLHLVPGSPAIDAGVAIPAGPVDDFDGETRDDRPDVGADEFRAD